MDRTSITVKRISGNYLRVRTVERTYVTMKSNSGNYARVRTVERRQQREEWWGWRRRWKECVQPRAEVTAGNRCSLQCSSGQ